jgi:hypothetical protein
MKSEEIALSTFSSKSSLPSLPSNFAMTIIEKEIELEKCCSPSLISELVELYSQAIEFYNFNNDPKCYDYQDRMHKMLLRPSVLSTLSPEKQDRSKSPLPDPKKDFEKSKKLIAAELNSSLSVTSHKAERTIIRAIDQNENETKEVAVKLADNFKMQDNDLLNRLESRRKLNRTFTGEAQVETQETVNNLTFTQELELGESDKSAGFAVSKGEISRKIEDLMEMHFAEKAAKIAEINVRYEREILEMQDEGVMALVVNQMRQNMKDEIESVSKEFDERRRAEIMKLKQELQGFV